MKDKYSCDYNSGDVQPDRRFVLCKNDALLTVFSYLFMIIATWTAAYRLSPKEVSEMRYLFGFPLWYSVCTIICLCYSAAGIVWAVRSRKFTLDARGDDKEVE